MDSSDGQLVPEALRALAAVDLDRDGAGLRILPDFLPVEATAGWIRDIVAPGCATEHDFLVFGEACDGELDCTAFWLARAGAAIAEQPVVSIGSHTPQLLARNLSDFLWYLADAFNSQEIEGNPEEGDSYELIRIAERFAPDVWQAHRGVEQPAGSEFPHFAALFKRM